MEHRKTQEAQEKEFEAKKREYAAAGFAREKHPNQKLNQQAASRKRAAKRRRNKKSR